MAVDPGSPEAEVTGPATRRRLAAAFGAVALLVALDQLTKAWAVEVLADGPIEVVGKAVRFNLTRNPGASFSSFQGFTPILAVAAVFVTIYLVRSIGRTRDRVLLTGLVLVLAGAIGNLIDRIARSPGFLRGAVVDFIDVGPWPIWNVADACITIGVVVLVAHSLFGRHDDDE